MGASVLAAIDPRAKLVAFLAVQGLLFVPSPQPPGIRLAALAVLLLVLLPTSGRSWRLWLRLLAISAPLLAFLALSAYLQPGAGGTAPPRVGLLIAAKAALSLLSLALFILNEEPGRLLQALRQAGLPRAVVVILAIGYRFSGQWRLELEGMRRAWTGRNFAALPMTRRVRQLATALPLYFERLLESGVHVHDAMVSRGFNGALPSWRRLAFSRRDAAFLAIVAAFAAAVAML
jgi:cobalt/nickel transport system permease protein